tara:strand:+ start:6279 stop:6494 length:216 start_codon:yes stop_codon:yes gene_type:complete
MDKQYVAYIEKDEDGIFVGSVPSVPGCYTEGDTYKEVTENLQQVLKLCIRNMRPKSKMQFVGIQNISVVHG